MNDEEPTPEDELEELHPLPDGEAFQPNESSVVLGRSPASVIVFGGAHRSGKTTLIASLYERFVRTGPLGGYSFVYSRTLIGFERLCFLGRLTSDLNAPEMPRTSKLNGSPTYHLQVARAPYRERRDTLLCDVPGELFDELRDGASELEELALVKTADRFVFLVDGARLGQLETRHVALDRAQTTLRALVEAQLLHPSSCVDLVIAKWDAIESAGAENYANESLETLSKALQGRVREVVVERVIARAHAGGHIPAEGVDAMFERWLSSWFVPARPEFPSVEPRREIDRFAAQQG